MKEIEELKHFLLTHKINSSPLDIAEIIAWQPPKRSWKKKKLQHFKKFLDNVQSR